MNNARDGVRLLLTSAARLLFAAVLVASLVGCEEQSSFEVWAQSQMSDPLIMVVLGGHQPGVDRVMAFQLPPGAREGEGGVQLQLSDRTGELHLFRTDCTPLATVQIAQGEWHLDVTASGSAALTQYPDHGPQFTPVLQAAETTCGLGPP